ncbi:membrane dipeptidase [Deinococcus radiophilus]|uniref:membrane dipeptidase n=1 Tax=Deinococcus radiophilus TaxID=32062 RepID=UPI00360EA989
MAHKLIDGHLDLAHNALEGRDPRMSLEELRRIPLLSGVPGHPPQTPSLTFAELQAAGVGVCFGTLFARKGGQWPLFPDGYTDAESARGDALLSLDLYRRWEDEALIRLLRDRTDMTTHLDACEAGGELPIGVALLMEGADPVRDADDLPFWVDQGVRMIGLAWRGTRYAGGTGEPGGLTDAGHELMQAMSDLDVTLDASHLDDAAFWEAFPTAPA